MSDVRYGFRTTPDGPITETVFGFLPFKTREAVEHTGEKWRAWFIEYVETHDDGETWQVCEDQRYNDPELMSHE